MHALRVQASGAVRRARARITGHAQSQTVSLGLRPGLGLALRSGARRAFTATHMSVADLLAVSKQFRSKQTHFLFEHQTLRDAVQSLAQNENSATLVVVNDNQQVVGMLTNHLVLAQIAKMKRAKASGDDDHATVGWDTKVSEFFLPAREILHVAPEDSLENVRGAISSQGSGTLDWLADSAC